MTATKPLHISAQIAVDEAVRPLRNTLREIHGVARSALADGGMTRTRTSALMEIDRLANAGLRRTA